jgi:hypothetical protein
MEQTHLAAAGPLGHGQVGLAVAVGIDSAHADTAGGGIKGQ